MLTQIGIHEHYKGRFYLVLGDAIHRDIERVLLLGEARHSENERIYLVSTGTDGKMYAQLPGREDPETGQRSVAYIPLYPHSGPGIAIRPFAMFHENVEVGKRRFKYLGQNFPKDALRGELMPLMELRLTFMDKVYSVREAQPANMFKQFASNEQHRRMALNHLNHVVGQALEKIESTMWADWEGPKLKEVTTGDWADYTTATPVEDMRKLYERARGMSQTFKTETNWQFLNHVLICAHVRVPPLELTTWDADKARVAQDWAEQYYVRRFIREVEVPEMPSFLRPYYDERVFPE